MLNIYLTRHGQNVDNLAGILNGHRDMPLTEKGVEQAHEIADKIKEAGLVFDAVYSSPLSRAYETAKVISKTIGAPAPVKEPLLIERDYGVMTGEKISDIPKLCAPHILKTEIITYFLEAEGAESWPVVKERGAKLLTMLRTKHKDGNILLVAHGDIGKMTYASYYNLDWEDTLIQFHFGNCDLLLLSPDSSAQDTHVFKIVQHNH